MENQFKAILPMNPITEKIYYTNDSIQNQRFVISAMSENPRVWQVSKVEDMLMGEFGLMRLTFAQTEWNISTDYIDRNAINPDGTKDLYAMYANYYTSTVPPVESDCEPQKNRCLLSASTNSIKIGGSYKTITATIYDDKNNDVTNSYLSDISLDNWHFYIDNEDITNSGLLTILEQTNSNKIKIKFTNNTDFLTKILVVKLQTADVEGELLLELVSL